MNTLHERRTAGLTGADLAAELVFATTFLGKAKPDDWVALPPTVLPAFFALLVETNLGLNQAIQILRSQTQNTMTPLWILQVGPKRHTMRCLTFDGPSEGWEGDTAVRYQTYLHWARVTASGKSCASPGDWCGERWVKMEEWARHANQ